MLEKITGRTRCCKIWILPCRGKQKACWDFWVIVISRYWYGYDLVGMILYTTFVLSDIQRWTGRKITGCIELVEDRDRWKVYVNASKCLNSSTTLRLTWSDLTWPDLTWPDLTWLDQRRLSLEWGGVSAPCVKCFTVPCCFEHNIHFPEQKGLCWSTKDLTKWSNSARQTFPACVEECCLSICQKHCGTNFA